MCGVLLDFLRLLRFLRSTLSLKSSHRWGRWLDKANAAHAQSKSSSGLPSLCSTKRHTGALFDKPLPTSMERATCVPGDPVSYPQSARTECTYSRTTRSCARSVIRARRSQCGVPQLALRAYPDDALEDRGGTRPRFVERGDPHKSYHDHHNHSIWVWEW